MFLEVFWGSINILVVVTFKARSELSEVREGVGFSISQCPALPVILSLSMRS